MRKVKDRILAGICLVIAVFTLFQSGRCIISTYSNGTANTPGGQETLARMGVYLAAVLTLIISAVYLIERKKE